MHYEELEMVEMKNFLHDDMKRNHRFFKQLFRRNNLCRSK